MIASIVLVGALVHSAEDPILAEPAFALLKGLVGGTWIRKIQGGEVRQHYSFQLDGRAVVGDTEVLIDGKKVREIHCRFGWDPKVKAVYYLDAHDNDTVYWGHATATGPQKLKLDFGNLTNDKEHYEIVMEFVDADHVAATMGETKLSELVRRK